MKYEWDEKKRSTNIKIHGVDFKDIYEFDWATCFTIPDERFEENRYLAFGLIGKRLHAMAYTIRETKIRLISLRKANRREIRRYENHISG